ncbi:MAG: hypothetical protein WCK48_00490 [bacterium]
MLLSPSEARMYNDKEVVAKGLPRLRDFLAKNHQVSFIILLAESPRVRSYMQEIAKGEHNISRILGLAEELSNDFKKEFDVKYTEVKEDALDQLRRFEECIAFLLKKEGVFSGVESVIQSSTVDELIQLLQVRFFEKPITCHCLVCESCLERIKEPVEYLFQSLPTEVQEQMKELRDAMFEKITSTLPEDAKVCAIIQNADSTELEQLIIHNPLPEDRQKFLLHADSCPHCKQKILDLKLLSDLERQFSK